MNKREINDRHLKAKIVSCAFFLFLILSPSAFASTWTLETADFRSRQVNLVVVNAEEVKFAAIPEAATEIVSMAGVLQLSHALSGGEKISSGYVLIMGSGDRVMGKPISIGGENLNWQNELVGAMTVPLKEVRSMGKAAAVEGSIEQPVPVEDTLTFSNGDMVKGIITGMSDGKIAVTQQGGGSLNVSLDSLANVAFASAVRPATTAPTRAFRARLKDGSLITAKSVSVSGENVELRLSDGASRKLAASAVGSIEQVNGPVTFLSSLKPSEDVQKPYLGDPWPTRFDRTVTGQDLPTHFTRGIGVHSYSRVTYTLDPADGYKEFRTLYAMDGAGAYANVTVRIWIDGKPAYEQKNVTSPEPSAVVKVSVAGARTLALEVDYGLSNDTQDRFVWLEPALLRDAVR